MIWRFEIDKEHNWPSFPSPPSLGSTNHRIRLTIRRRRSIRRARKVRVRSEEVGRPKTVTRTWSANLGRIMAPQPLFPAGLPCHSRVSDSPFQKFIFVRPKGGNGVRFESGLEMRTPPRRKELKKLSAKNANEIRPFEAVSSRGGRKLLTINSPEVK